MSEIATRIAIADADRHAGETVKICGWLYNLRRSGKICFPLLRDGTGILQCVAVKSNLPEELFEALKNLTQESSLIVTGKLKRDHCNGCNTCCDKQIGNSHKPPGVTVKMLNQRIKLTQVRRN